MQSECNRLMNLIKEHETTIVILTKKYEATIHDVKCKMMAESNTNILTSIDETRPINF